jgi:hypothetical protein
MTGEEFSKYMSHISKNLSLLNTGLKTNNNYNTHRKREELMKVLRPTTQTTP